jgi:Nickel responsive protein SCO4226-like
VPTYLVERYWPGVTSELLLEALKRGRRVMEEISGEGTRVRDISCTLIPSEEVVFSVYEGPSATAVRQLNERAGIPVSRIVEAIIVTGDHCSLALSDQMPWSRSIPSTECREGQHCRKKLLKLTRVPRQPEDAYKREEGRVG